MKPLAALASILAALCLGSAASAQPNASGELVATQGGQLQGVTLASGVHAYLGVPYAAPPVRDLRWRDPQPAARWTGVRHADRFGPQCVQPLRGILTNQYSGAEVSSEDCLYLNVWTRPELKKAPVVVFLHGGAFFIGSGSMALYGGEGVAERGAVFVNLNYRLGILGFLSHPALTAESPHKSSGDYGFLDQIAALKWVKANIAAFGGDPDNVTIVGQSAGSMSVLTLQASPLAKGLFQKAVGMSGAQIGAPGEESVRPLAKAEAEGVKFQALMKAKSLDELRALPADRLVVPRTPGAPGVGPDVDGYVLPMQTGAIFARGQQNDVPLMVGFAHDESFGGLGAIKDLADYRSRVQAKYGARAAQFLALYPAANDDEAIRQARAADRDATMVVGMSAWARAQSATGHAPVYSYMFARAHSYAPGVRFSDMDPATAGAYHTSEVPFWLGSLESFNQFRHTRDWTPEDRAFSRAMTDSLVAFAKTGVPDTAQLHWPRYDARQPMLLELNAEAKPAAWPDQRKLDFFNADAAAALSGPVRD